MSEPNASPCLYVHSFGDSGEALSVSVSSKRLTFQICSSIHQMFTDCFPVLAPNAGPNEKEVNKFQTLNVW